MPSRPRKSRGPRAERLRRALGGFGCSAQVFTAARVWGAAALAIAVLAAPPRTSASNAPDAEGLEFFERHVRPLLISHCYECHSADETVKGGLVIDSRAGWELGGDSGPALVPGDPDASLIVQSVRYTDPILQMPPKTRLSTAEVEILEKWIAMGAPDPREGEVYTSQHQLFGISIS